MSLSICLFTFGFSVEATSLFHLFHLCQPSTNHCNSRYCVTPSTSAASVTNPTEAEEDSIESELYECSTPPAKQPASTSSTSSAQRTSGRSHREA